MNFKLINKISVCIFAAAVIFVGCGKDVTHSLLKDQDAWITQVDLPVPIRLGSQVLTKSEPYDGSDMTLEDMLGVFAIDKTEGVLFNEGGTYLKNVKAEMLQGEISFMTPVYYPTESKENLSFYAYHARQSEEDVQIEIGPTTIDIPVTLGTRADVLWATSKAETLDSGLEGFNAPYIREVARRGLQNHLNPMLKFEHMTSCLEFYIKKELNTTGNKFDQRIRMRGLVIDNVYTMAKLRIADKRSHDAATYPDTDINGNRLDENGNRMEGFLTPIDGTIGSLEVVPGSEDSDLLRDLPTTQTRYGYLYICPHGEQKTISGKLNFIVYPDRNSEENSRSYTVPFSFDMSKISGALKEFKAGYKYTFVLNVKESAEVLVEAIVEDYKDAWAEDEVPVWDVDNM